LTEELVRQGHEVTLFASGDSETAAELVACAPTALRLAQVTNELPYSVLQLEKIRRRAGDFDIAHFHSDFLHFPLVRSLGTPSVTTLHGRLDLPFYQLLLDEFPEMPLVSISDDQRRLLPAQWIATVLHGLPRDLYSFSAAGDGGYLAFLGRISPEKRADRAIEIAKRAGVQLKIAAKVDKVDQTYFDEEIRPLIKGPAVRERFEQRFTIERVAHDYVRVYHSLAAEPIMIASGTRRSPEPRPLRATLGRGTTMQQTPLRAMQQPPLHATAQTKQGMTV
jgi:glycosyltransferase involved in cell wall biosynthesis